MGIVHGFVFFMLQMDTTRKLMIDLRTPNPLEIQLDEDAHYLEYLHPCPLLSSQPSMPYFSNHFKSRRFPKRKPDEQIDRDFDRNSTADSLDTSLSLEVNSTVESLFTQSSTGSGGQGNSEERRLEQRQKQIDYGKNTIGYQRYTSKIDKRERSNGDPETPDKYSRCSKRAWDGLVRSWRRKLHKYDPLDT